MMNYRKQGLRVLGLAFVAVLGLTAFMASGAQANWLILHPGTGKVEEPEVTLKVEHHTDYLNLLVKEETNLEILCLDLVSDPLAPPKLLAKSTVAHGHINFSKCLTWQNGKDVTANCKPVEPISAGGLAEVILHTISGGANHNFILFKPLTAGGNFALVKFKEPCALPESNKVFGTLLAECGHLEPANTFVHLDCKNHQKVQLLQEVPETSALFAHALKYGANKKALLDGIAAARISAPALYLEASFGGHI